MTDRIRSARGVTGSPVVKTATSATSTPTNPVGRIDHEALAASRAVGRYAGIFGFLPEPDTLDLDSDVSRRHQQDTGRYLTYAETAATVAAYAEPVPFRPYEPFEADPDDTPVHTFTVVVQASTRAAARRSLTWAVKRSLVNDAEVV